MLSNGYLYVATGSKYILEAASSAKSLREVEPSAQICLVTDEQYENSLFDQIKIISINTIENKTWKAKLVYKIVGIQNSPFEQTLFIDTDMYFVHSVAEVFEQLNYFDLLCCLDYYDQSIVRSMAGEQIPSYTPYNTGMLFFRNNDRVIQFLADWKKYYERGIDAYWSDQPAFMEALLYHDIKTYVLHSSFNFRFQFNVGFLENEKVRIIHGRASESDFKIIADRVNSTLSQRVWVASLRKCFTWTPSPKDKLLRTMYGLLPEFLKTALRSFRG